MVAIERINDEIDKNDKVTVIEQGNRSGQLE